MKTVIFPLLLLGILFTGGHVHADIVFEKKGDKTYTATPTGIDNIDGIEELFMHRHRLLQGGSASYSLRMDGIDSKRDSILSIDIPAINDRGEEETVKLDVVLPPLSTRIAIQGGHGNSPENAIRIGGIRSNHEEDEIIDAIVENMNAFVTVNSTESIQHCETMERVNYSDGKQDKDVYIVLDREGQPVLNELKKQTLEQLGQVTWRTVEIGNLGSLSVPSFLASEKRTVSGTTLQGEPVLPLSQGQRSYLNKRGDRESGILDTFRLPNEFFISESHQSFYMKIKPCDAHELASILPMKGIDEHASPQTRAEQIVSACNTLLYHDNPLDNGNGYLSPYILEHIGGVPVITCYLTVPGRAWNSFHYHYVYFLNDDRYLLIVFGGTYEGNNFVWKEYIRTITRSFKPAG